MPTLTESSIRGAKPKDKAYKLYDEKGLFLLVTPTGRTTVALQIPVRWR
jgi:hypothetical protein